MARIKKATQKSKSAAKKSTRQNNNGVQTGDGGNIEDPGPTYNHSPLPHEDFENSTTYASLRILFRNQNKAIRLVYLRNVLAEAKGHGKRVKATADYEDFLYYQSTARRFNQGLSRRTDEQHGEVVVRKRKPLWLTMEENKAEGKDLVKRFMAAKAGVGMATSNRMRQVRHDQLHWCTPVPRSSAVGLGLPEPEYLNPLVLVIEQKALEQRRKQVEDKRGITHDYDGRLMWNSHSERRTVENAEVEDLIRSDDVLANALKRTRQVSGLHVSAVERQDDWPTSYDRLGIARQNYIVRMPARQGEIEDEPLNARPDRDAAAYRAISYTYETTASITEATEGRRERHVHGAIRPSSPVDSPPHSPIYDEDQEKGSEEGNPEGRKGRSSRPIPEDVSPEHSRYQEYRTKFTDHYGVKRGQVGGFRVPYEPFNRRTLPSDERSKFPRINMEELVDDQGLLKEPAPEGTSMQILEVAAGNMIDPSISGALGPQTLQDLDSSPDFLGNGDGENGGDDSDGGDLFRSSYLRA